MSASINTVLGELQTETETLVEQITKYEAAGAIAAQVAQSLKEACEALTETQKHIEPFTAVWSRRVLVVTGMFLGTNSVLLIFVVFLLLFR